MLCDQPFGGGGFLALADEGKPFLFQGALKGKVAPRQGKRLRLQALKRALSFRLFGTLPGGDC